MKRKLLPLLLLIIGLIAGIAVGYGVSSYSSAKTVQTSATAATVNNPPTRAELLKLVNEERAKIGIKPLKESLLLDKSAQWKADDEVIYNYFGHFRDGKFIGQQFIDDTGITCSLDDENLAWVTPSTSLETAQSAMNGWISSKPHYEAMVNPKYTLTGFGIVHDAIVEHFCQP